MYVMVAVPRGYLCTCSCSANRILMYVQLKCQEDTYVCNGCDAKRILMYVMVAMPRGYL